MPPVALAATAAAATSLASAGAITAATLTIAATQAAIAGGLALVGQLLAPSADKGPAPSSIGARDRKLLVRSTVSPHRVIYGRAKVTGTLVHSATTGTDNEYLHLFIAIAGHSIDAVEKIWFGDELIGTLQSDGLINDGRLSGQARIRFVYGSSTQAADALAVSEIPGWTSEHRLLGLSYAWIRLKASRDQRVWPTGIPRVQFLVRGKNDIYDPRDQSTGWTDNAALCQRDYIVWKNGVNDQDVDDTTWSTAANRCDETVALDAGGTEARYTCNGAFELDSQPRAALEELLSASAGRAVYTGGVWRGYAAGYDAPVKQLNADNLRGDVGVEPRPARQGLFNRVRGTFIDSRGDLWADNDFPPVANALYESEDGEQITRDIRLPFTAGDARAQRIGRLELERHRQSIIATLPINASGHELQPWDVIGLTITQLGWDAKEFRVIDWKLDSDGGTTLIVREEAAAIYDWNAGQALTFDPAPNTLLPSAFDVPPPESVTVSEALYSARDGGGVKVSMSVTWTAPANVFARRYEIEHKRPGDTDFDGGREVTKTTWTAFDVSPGRHELRVRSLNGLGYASDWTTKTYDVIGKTAPPADITGLTITAVAGTAFLRWDLHPDLDVREGGNIAIRHSASQSGAVWETSRPVGKALPGNSMLATLPLLPGSYLVKAKDEYGYSTNAVAVSTKGAIVGAFTQAASLTEGPVWTGTHSGTAAPDGQLKLAAAVNIDSLPGDIDDYPDWDSMGGVLTAGIYDFGAGMDFGAVKTVRLSVALTPTVFQPLDLWDDRPGDIDSWGLVDGDINGDEAGAEVWVRETDDDPNGSPTWSAWQLLDVGEYSARALQFQARLYAADSSFNVTVLPITITADEAT